MLLTLLSLISFVPHSGGNKKDPIPDCEDRLGVLGVPDGVPLLSFANLPPRLVAVLWLQHGACKARSHFQTSRVQPGENFKSNSQVIGCLKFGVELNQQLTGDVLNKLRSRNTSYRTILSRFPSGYDQPLDVGDLYFP